ncbi:single-stranded DNA-binding protein [Staphylococcus pseudintermedius]|uniref:single-stranded DNA-binding protein n=1 Tax=Staphylococcus pseudintermedius TaxID=283734 RepID=UPI00143F62CC|nr:single-stranded DNA-binding protein [Staphylococcus pseudintermedius]EGQ3717858.1 single-stranded DNA-binding protein [Staphylococcus pseudintermedius]EGQ4407684.1 single-stranded DNA-binding protein [Staphylococcus pseudintermedius]MDE9985321.1 single-stranded DNA-binding protein [Staphylococcus pseudintermedius]MDE9987672.1 single-stranded DNA-binding protein [Staphylococcus pseudintermedius]MDE9999686.1 single-stranded DNA-binding protein [Staphylococcus pseudintermedius]
MNNAQVVGNLVDEIELKTFQSGDKEVTVANGVVACNERFGQKEITSFIDFTVYNSKAKVIKEYVGKGQQIGLSGKLRAETYEDKQGIKRKKTYLYVDSVDLPQKQKQDETSH